MHYCSNFTFKLIHSNYLSRFMLKMMITSYFRDVEFFLTHPLKERGLLKLMVHQTIHSYLVAIHPYQVEVTYHPYLEAFLLILTFQVVTYHLPSYLKHSYQAASEAFLGLNLA